MAYWIESVKQHLKSDSKKWKKLSVSADKEYKEDLKLLKRLK